MAPREGNSIVKHGVLDERLNVHGVKGLKVADLSICPDNVGCNTYSTALLIGEKCAMLTAEDLGYSGRALDMKVPEYHAPRYVMTALLSPRIVANVKPGRSPACRVCKRTCLGVASKLERVQKVPRDSYDSLTYYDVYMTVMKVLLISSPKRSRSVLQSSDEWTVMTSDGWKMLCLAPSCPTNQTETTADGR